MRLLHLLDHGHQVCVAPSDDDATDWPERPARSALPVGIFVRPANEGNVSHPHRPHGQVFELGGREMREAATLGQCLTQRRNDIAECEASFAQLGAVLISMRQLLQMPPHRGHFGDARQCEKTRGEARLLESAATRRATKRVPDR